MATEKTSLTGYNGLQVIGAGLPRTGTSSLQHAFDLLNYKPCHHFAEVAKANFPFTEARLWQEACRLKHDDAARKAVLNQIYEKRGYKAGCDTPTCFFVKELVEMYPDAKVVLGLRNSPQAWRKSVNTTVGQVVSNWHYWSCFWLPSQRISQQPLFTLVQEHVKDYCGKDLLAPMDNVAVYDAHNEYIRSVVPKDRLLEHNAADGWEPLCKHLGVAIPTDAQGNKIPYPHVNDTKALQALMFATQLSGLFLWVLVIGGPIWALRLAGLF